MVRVSVLYPATDDARFDHEYYLRTHMSLVKERLEPLGLRGVEVDRGVTDGTGAAPAFVTIAHMLFDSAKDFEQAFARHGGELVADLPNFTEIQPQIQISEIVA